MSSVFASILQTLFLGFDSLAPWDEEGEPKIAMLRAAYSPRLQDYEKSREWYFEQSFAPYADGLTHAGFPVKPELDAEPESFDRVLMVATRFGEENALLFARALRMLKAGGMLVVAQHNDLGAKRIDSQLKRIGSVQAVSKYHCRAVALQKPEKFSAEAEKALREWQAFAKPVMVAGTDLQAVAGLFSAKKVDEGSALLVKHLSKSLSGRGADVAAGWGYLTAEVLKKCANVQHITLYEAEKRAIDMAEHNLETQKEKLHFVWADAAKPLQTSHPFDFIVMNPPAHDLYSSLPEMSQAILESAHKALRPQGKLFLVVNRHLPYERKLEDMFTTFATLAQTGEYKVLEAMK